MEVLYPVCCALDVHQASVTACLRAPGDGPQRRQEVRTFGTTTRELLGLAAWLTAAGRASRGPGGGSVPASAFGRSVNFVRLSRLPADGVKVREVLLGCGQFATRNPARFVRRPFYWTTFPRRRTAWGECPALR
jgi:hypothetical protein